MVLVKVLWVKISRIYWQFWHSAFKFTFKSSSIFHIPLEKHGEICDGSVCLKPLSINETVTFAYIMTFHFTSEFAGLVMRNGNIQSSNGYNQILETHTAYWKKNNTHGFTDNSFLSVKPRMYCTVLRTYTFIFLKGSCSP